MNTENNIYKEPGDCILSLKMEPDVSKLTREYFIKSSSISTTESSVILLTQTALALQQAEKEYKEALLAVVFLLEYKLTVLGNAQEEARIWDLILEGRSLINNTKKKRDDLEILFSRTLALVNNASEVAFMTGADIVGSSAGDRLNKIDLAVREERIKSEQAEQKLQGTELKVINVEGKYAEEHAEELEEERQKLLQDLSGDNSGGKETESNDKTHENSGVTDISDTIYETLTDDTAKEI
ncbi:uncharacterized protein LOC123530481 isoform X2 [Mercenaria mercenaria]|uniref:uncharacterized protein LOC123530481 isoform X2 n=1 Tax=Mercenaria mercenaria TaxID=6596 RepID=UPI00234E4949|nr:uncharacterized protein LOC123530481 isoform X2 [Mercenaria mercenaria]